MRRLQIVMLLAALMAVTVFGQARPAEKEWTWMVFINADNNLDGYGVDDQEEMARVGSSDHLNIVTLIDRQHGPASLNFIEKGNVRLVRELGEADMGDWNQLTAFFEEAAARFPARHYALTVWNHGAGWRRNRSNLKGISYDDTNGTNISTQQLGQAVREITAHLGRKLDLLCMDACLMQMMEVAWEVRDGCDFVVASEETEPGDGYPYEMILERLVPGITPRALAQNLVKAYEIFYQNLPEEDDRDRADCADLADRPGRAKKTTQSAVECQKLPALKDALDGLAKAAMAGNAAAAFKSAGTDAQRFYYWSNMDLIHFLRLLQKDTTDPALKTAARRAEEAALEIVIANGTTGSNPTDDGDWGEYDPDRSRSQGRAIDAYGLAIYFPLEATGFSAEYQDLAFARDSRWDEMAQDFYHKSAVTPVLAALRGGDLDPLARFAATANANNRALCRRLLREANFALFADSPRPRADLGRYGRLVEEMLARTRQTPAEPW